jgi:hypothetical protein
MLLKERTKMSKKKDVITVLTCIITMLLGLMLPEVFAEQPIRVTNPTKETCWIAGDFYPVKWTGTSLSKGKATIGLVEKQSLNTVQDTIEIGDIPNSGSYDFRIRDDIPSGSYRIWVETRITWDTISRDNSSWFKIVNPDEAAASIKIISPEGGENIEPGTTYTFKWKADILCSHVRIAVSKEGGQWEFITDDIPNNGNHSWHIPEHFPEGSVYKIGIAVVGTEHMIWTNKGHEFSIEKKGKVIN